jgi:hypothetical protein
MPGLRYHHRGRPRWLTRAPIPDALVSLANLEAAEISRPAAPFTDAKGRFAFVNLPAGGAACGQQRNYLDGGYNQTLAGAAGGAIAARQWCQVKLVMWRPGAISGPGPTSGTSQSSASMCAR